MKFIHIWKKYDLNCVKYGQRLMKIVKIMWINARLRELKELTLLKKGVTPRDSFQKPQKSRVLQLLESESLQP